MADSAPAPVDQVEFWNGAVGRTWAADYERLDRAFAPLTAALLEAAAVQPGQQVIDVGCGAGVLSLALAPRLGRGGRILAVDISRPLLERARARDAEAPAADRAEIDWQEADAGSFPFTPGAFDVLLSRFGTMFFSDPVAAFANMRRALKPSGRLVMLCWRPLEENPWITVPRAAMLQVVPPPPPVPPDAPGPFAFADAARVGAILARAGFNDVRSTAARAVLEPYTAGPESPLEQAVAFATELGPPSSLLREVDEQTRRRAVDAVRHAYRARPDAARPRLEAACWVYTAVQPG